MLSQIACLELHNSGHNNLHTIESGTAGLINTQTLFRACLHRILCNEFVAELGSVEDERGLQPGGAHHGGGTPWGEVCSLGSIESTGCV